MKYRILFVFQLFLFLNMEITALAMSTGFSKEALSVDELHSFHENFVITVVKAEPKKKSIECFDVSEKGLIAVGCSDSFMSTKRSISVYSDDGSFLYGYTFKSYGKFGVEWDQDNVIIYLVRGDGAVVVNPDGKVESVSKIQKTFENNSYWRNHVFSTERIVGDVKYVLKNNMGILNLIASSYSQIVTENSSGEMTVIYDAGAYHLVSMLVMVTVILLIICISIVCLAREVIKQRYAFKAKNRCLNSL